MCQVLPSFIAVIVILGLIPFSVLLDYWLSFTYYSLFVDFMPDFVLSSHYDFACWFCISARCASMNSFSAHMHPVWPGFHDKMVHPIEDAAESTSLQDSFTAQGGLIRDQETQDYRKSPHKCSISPPTSPKLLLSPKHDLQLTPQ